MMKDNVKSKGQILSGEGVDYKAIFQAVPSAVRVVDTDFNVIIANPPMAALSGQSLEASVGRKCFDTFKGERCHTKDCPLTRVQKTKTAMKAEVVKERQDGTKLICVCLAAPLFNREGMLTGMVESFEDITKQRQAEALRATSSYTRSLIEASLDPLVTIGADGKIMDVNKATELVTGVSRERLIGTDFSNYFTEPEKAREGYKKVFSEGSVTDYPLTIRHTSERTTDVLYNAAVYKDEAGKVQGVFAAARDITERKKTEEALAKQTEIIQRQAREILEISTPVMQVWEGVLVAPLIGTLDSQRTQQFMERLLERIVESNSPMALVDVTGVPTIDTQTAQHLIDTISAVRLLGAQVILTGIRPAIAQTLVHLGVDLSGITTRSSLSGGLLVAMDSLGLQVATSKRTNGKEA